MCKISIVIPGIRTNKWQWVYDSIDCEDFEVIFVGPYELPKSLCGYKNVKYVRDFGSPNRCQQIGACLAEGKYITWTADDGVYMPDQLTKAIVYFEEQLKKHGDNYVLSLKYGEGGNVMTDPNYYLLGNAYPFSQYIPHTKPILNEGILSRLYFEHLGGWDCRFEVTCMAHADLAIRIHNDTDSTIELFDDPILMYEHMPGDTGDHAPVAQAQTNADIPAFRNLYSTPQPNRTTISMSTWKCADAIWKRRSFK